MKRIVCLLLVLLSPIVRSELAFRPDAPSFTANAGEERKLECRYYGTEYNGGSLSLIGPAVGSDRSEISGNGVTRLILTIRDVEISDAGTYTCYHTSGEEVEAELIVFDFPEFLNVPVEQTLIDGSNGIVQCPVYLGHPPATLQWFKDNSEITTTPGSRFSVESDGLHITDVGMQDRGEYRCLLERQGWGAEFRDITVDVQPASPCIDKSIHPLVEVLYNEAVAIHCTLMTECAEAEVWWVKPNGAIVREQTLHLEAPHTRGIYSCFARNNNGDDRYDVSLDIRVPPLPPTNERSVSVNEGQTIMLSAELDMEPNPKPTHTWQSAEGESIPLQQGPQGGQRIYVTAEGRLVIQDVSIEDSGTYRWTVQNEHGMSVQTITLQVVPPPTTPSPTRPTTTPTTTPTTPPPTQPPDDIKGCGGQEDEDGASNCPQGSDNMLVPVVVTLSVVCVVVVLGAVAAVLLCRRSRRSPQVAEVEHGPKVIPPMKPQMSSDFPPYSGNMEAPVSVTTPCPFPHPSYPAGPFHQQPLTPQPRSHKSPQ